MNFQETLAFAGAIPPSVPLFFLGQPGGGKSAVARATGLAAAKAAAEAKTSCVVIRRELTGHLPEDLSGLPFAKDGYSHFFPPAFLGKLAKGSGPGGSDPFGVLVLEDITQAQRAVQCACFQLVQERSMGDVELSDRVRIILTGNRASDKAGARELPSPLRNRVMLLTLTPEPEEWMYWAASQGLPGVIGAFLNYKPEFFSQLPNQGCKQNGQFATPRAWENVGRVYDACIAMGGPGASHAALTPLLTACGGLLGDGTATEFVGFVRLQKELPDPQLVLDNPKKALPNPPGDPDRLTALVAALGEYAAKSKKKDAPLKLLLALAHVSSKSREGTAAGIACFQANGGDVTALVEQADAAQEDPRVLAVLTFFAESTK